MCRKFNVILVTILAAVVALRGQSPGGTPFRIERLDPALDDLIAADAQLETLGDRFALTEGALWVPEGQDDGYLLFSDNAANVVYKWQRGRPLTVFLEKSGFTGTDISRVGAQTVAGRVPILLIGSNGLALDPQGRLVVTAMNDRTVYRLEAGGTRTILADRFEGKRFNGPNDIVIASNGNVYFTDTVWGLRDAEKDAARELPFSGFFLIKDGRVTLLGSDQNAPGRFANGITLSPDEKVLYVTSGANRTMRYDVLPDGGIANGRLFVEHGSDGMRVDSLGNLYTTSGGTPGVVQITSPAGVPLGRLHLPQPAGEPRARVLEQPRNRGKGHAVRVGMLAAEGQFVLFCDADLSTPPQELDKFWPWLDSGYEVVIGSRKMAGANVSRRQPLWRESLGKGFTWLTNIIAAPGISDVTCGFKCFTHHAAQTLFSLSLIEDWSFDAEVLFIAQQLGYRIKEVPVSWHDEPGTKVRLWKDSVRSLLGLATIRANFIRGRYKAPHNRH